MSGFIESILSTDFLKLAQSSHGFGMNEVRCGGSSYSARKNDTKNCSAV
jgi:hypothetical protein